MALSLLRALFLLIIRPGEAAKRRVFCDSRWESNLLLSHESIQYVMLNIIISWLVAFGSDLTGRSEVIVLIYRHTFPTLLLRAFCCI